MLNIAINGFGRIGRLLYRALIDRQAQVRIVAVHDLCDVHLARHLLVHDSHYGPWPCAVVVDGDDLLVHDQVTCFLQRKSLSELPWKQYKVDLVIESTGQIRERNQLSMHLKQGAKKVLLTTYSQNVDFTVIFGINHREIKSTDTVFSAASCTSNCLIPLLYILQNTYRVLWSNFLTVHAHTNDQQILDSAHRDWCRARSASQSMIPTSTNAVDVAKQFLPHIPIHGSCIRVPVTSVSVLYLTSQLAIESNNTLLQIQNLLIDQAHKQLSGIVSYTFEPLVSVDYKGHTASAVVDMHQLAYHVSTGHLFLTAWYDNEWGYVQRLVDIILYLHNYTE